ncbi:MAG: CBS domain-containing protein [Jatrophihabitantaceae bacterium]
MTTPTQRDIVTAAAVQRDAAGSAARHTGPTQQRYESALSRYLAAVAGEVPQPANPSAVEPLRAAARVVAEVMSIGVVSAREGALFKEIAGALIRNRISAVPVVDADHRVIGVVSESDLLARVAGRIGVTPRGHRLAGRGDFQRKVHGATARELMTAPAVTVTEHTPIVEAARIAAHNRVRRMPVVDELGKLVGIVTRGDLLRLFLRPDAEIEQEVKDYLRNVMTIDDTAVEATVGEGVVRLTGQLERSLQVRQLLEYVHGVCGVVEVVDQLTAREHDAMMPFPSIHY